MSCALLGPLREHSSSVCLAIARGMASEKSKGPGEDPTGEGDQAGDLTRATEAGLRVAPAILRRQSGPSVSLSWFKTSTT